MDNHFHEEESYRDRVSTVTESGKRNWIYALAPKGKFYNWRSILSALYIVVFVAIPFIKVNGLPLVMFNIVEGKFILFSKIFWPHDFFIFAVAMICFIIIIVLFTIIYGRLFCGWVCPQTVFMEFIFRKIEWWIEGSPSAQRKLNEGPWDTNKIIKKLSKHILFLIISFFIANIFLSYIIGVDQLYRIIKEPISDHLSLLFGLFFFSLLFYGVFAYVREIVCTTICPYGRLQGVMFDKNTMQIAYDYKRGEPRGRVKKGEERTHGDCVDCMKCVHVCPTGIDIRNGLQMECVGCTACIDACNEVMHKLNFQPNLIRYASEDEIKNDIPFKITNRMKAYTAVLIGLMIFLGALVMSRRSVDAFITRVKGQTYQELENGSKISNIFNAKIINKTHQEINAELRLEDGMQGEIKLVGVDHILLHKDHINEFSFFVTLPKGSVTSRKNSIKIGLYNGDEKIQTIKTTFLGPFN